MTKSVVEQLFGCLRDTPARDRRADMDRAAKSTQRAIVAWMRDNGFPLASERVAKLELGRK